MCIRILTSSTERKYNYETFQKNNRYKCRRISNSSIKSTYEEAIAIQQKKRKNMNNNKRTTDNTGPTH